MAIRSYTRAFNAGEISPAMFARIDDAKYQTGLAQCKNFLVEPQGPIAARPGFEYVSAVKDSSKKVKLIPFTFSNTQTMVLEFGEKYVRFYTQGKPLLSEDGSVYEVETPYMADDVFDLHYVQSADVLTIVHSRYAPQELRRYSLFDWRLTPIDFDSKLETPTDVSAIRKTAAADDPNDDNYTFQYKVSALNADKSKESRASQAVGVVANLYAYGTTVEISCKAVEGASYYRFYKNQGGMYGYIGDSDTTSIIDDNIAPDMSITPRNYDSSFAAEGGIVSASVESSGDGYESARNIYGHSNDGYKYRMYDGDDEGPVTLPCPYSSSSSFSVVVVDKLGKGSGAKVEAVTSVKSDGSILLEGFNIIEGGHDYVSPEIQVKFKVSPGTFYTYYSFKAYVNASSGVTLVVSDPTGSGARLEPVLSNGKITGVTIVSPGRGYTDPKITVVSERGSGAEVSVTIGESGNYPSAVGYFEQRRCFAGLNNDPQRVILTRSATEDDMTYSLPVRDDDRINVQIRSREFNQIRHVVPLSQLILLTSGSEMRVSPLNSDAITPSSFSVRPQAYVGASMVQPLVINSSMLYAASRGGHLRECGYNWQAGGFISADVCVRSPHLFDNLEIVDMTYAKAPWPIVWIVSSNGKLIAFTYVPDQQVGAFSTVETNGVIESCCAVAEGEEDVLYCVIKRNINGDDVRFVERMHERQYSSLSESVHLDCAGTYQGEKKDVITGLTWLEGMEVSILADGGVHPSQVVNNGSITLNEPASTVHVGLPYTCDMKTLPAAMALQDGSFGSGHRKNVRQVFFRVLDSSGMQAGPSFDNLTEYPARMNEYAGSAPSVLNDEVGFAIEPMWSNSGQVCVRQAYPLPLRIISMTVDMEIV